jgi:Protein of unknown function (DUF3108)
VPAIRRRSHRMLRLVVALFVVAPATALAQGRLEARYSVTVAGFLIGEGNWMIEINDRAYKAAASGTTTGLVHFFIGGHGSSLAKGLLRGGKPMSSMFVSTINTKRRTDEVRIDVDDGNVKDFHVNPPLGKDPDRVPITKEHERGILDPMTATLLRTPGTGDPVSAEACRRTLAIFDGRLRYDLKLAFKRMEHVKAEKGYDGAAAVCAVRFVPIAGFDRSRSAIKYLAKLRDMEIWLAPIAGTRVLVPFLFQLPTPIGKAVMRATEFVSVATPSRASVNGIKTQ